MTVEPVARRLQAMMATTPVVDRAPVPEDVAKTLNLDMRRLCAATAVRLCSEGAASGATQAEQVLLANIAVAEALAGQVALLRQELWAKAEKAGITKTAVAAARGVTQQAVSKRAAKSQRK